MNKEKLYNLDIATYGDEEQINQGIEEMAELIQAINKFRRNPCEETLNGIEEEIADVEIMLEQYKLIYKISDEEMSKHKSQKLKRLAKRLEIYKLK